jgi:hypothetical protein
MSFLLCPETDMAPVDIPDVVMETSDGFVYCYARRISEWRRAGLQIVTFMWRIYTHDCYVYFVFLFS